MSEQIHRLLVDAGIKHLCHYGSPFTSSDLGMASMTCAECNILNGSVSLEDALAGKIPLHDPRHMLGIYDSVYGNPHANRNKLRKLGLLPKHDVRETKLADGGTYQRVTCHLGRGSGAFEAENKCPICHEAVLV